MSEEINTEVDKRWQDAATLARQCSLDYKVFLASLRLLADSMHYPPEVILREALGNTEKRKTEKSIAAWMSGIERQWREITRRNISAAASGRARQDLLSQLQLTTEQCELLGIKP